MIDAALEQFNAHPSTVSTVETFSKWFVGSRMAIRKH